MDEQRFQAYVGLIEQLLKCPQGKEAALLQANAELVDAGLLAVMEKVAAFWEKQGNSSAGKRLRESAAWLTQNLEMRIASPARIETAGQFLIETLQLVADNKGKAQQIYPVWTQQQARFNEELLEVLTNITFNQDVEQRKFAAEILVLFGNLIHDFPLGIHWLNLELSIAAYKQALTVITQEAMPVEWVETMNNLAIAYGNRIQGDRAENLEQAIAFYQQILNVATPQAMPVGWRVTINNLAAAYRNRIRGDRAENLEQAINLYQQALKVTPPQTMPIEWGKTINNLGNAYLFRIRGDRAENLEQAINLFQQALTVKTQQTMPIESAETMSNLATAYGKRIRGDKAENLEQAIDLYQQVLKVVKPQEMPSLWITTMLNLANAYSFRIRGAQAENLEQAIDLYQQVLKVVTLQEMPIEWMGAMNNLATVYRGRIQGDKAENLEQAISSYQQLLKVMQQSSMPIDWAQTMNNLGDAYSERIRGDQVENLKQAIAAYQSSLEVFKPELLPNDCRRASRSLGNLYSEQQCWQEAAPIYQKALQASELLYQSANLLDSKATELAATADLPRRAAYALARSGNLKEAVLVLEQGRARGLSETLERDRSDLTRLQKTHLALFNQYQNITAQLRDLETQERLHLTSEERHNLTPEAFRTTALQLRQALKATIEQIRQVEGYADFLAQPDFNDIQQAVRPGVPLVYLVPTPQGSLALIVTQDCIINVWLDNFTETSLRRVLDNWFDSYRKNQEKRRVWAQAKKTHPVWQAFQVNQSRENGQAWLEIEKNHPVFQDAKKSEQAWLHTIDQVTHQLWQPLMAPLIDRLKQHSFQQATLIPTGYLSFLPLPAAWADDPTHPTGKRYALDEICFTYAPNARSLNVAAAIAQSNGTDSILAIDNPRDDLPNSSHEVAAAVATFPQRKLLKQEEATVESVLAALPHFTTLHLSCHGTANLNEPLNSGLLMSDGLLTLRNLLDLRLTEQEQGGIRLAVLSACETGLSGTELVDEAIGVPTGLLQAGVAGVVASLWSVSELSTMMLLVRFYDFWRKDGINPSEALRQAQRWVRDTTNKQKYDYFKSKLSDPLSSQGQLGITEAFLNEFMLTYVYPSGWEARYFTHPFHWAAFTYVGV